MEKKMTIYQKRMFKLIFGGLLYTVMMIVGSYLLSLFVEEDFTLIPAFLMIEMLLMIVVYIYRMIIAKKKEKLLFFRYGTLIALFLGLAVASILVYMDISFLYVVGTCYPLGLIIDRSFSLAHHHKGRNIFLAVTTYIYATLLMLVCLLPLVEELSGQYIVYVVIPLTFIFTSFLNAIKLVFSGLRRKTLMEIIKKTYTIEILYGLVTLMVAISIVLTVVDNGFNNYGDALWYCFAVVTTIGFGDFTVTSFVGRVLSVILGIYGIIVVALITSIIVNFYNASSHEKDDEIAKAVKELDKERKEISSQEDDEEMSKDK